jgi:hypothetical protein
MSTFPAVIQKPMFCLKPGSDENSSSKQYIVPLGFGCGSQNFMISVADRDP